jgi:hypothetical protein
MGAYHFSQQHCCFCHPRRTKIDHCWGWCLVSDLVYPRGHYSGTCLIVIKVHTLHRRQRRAGGYNWLEKASLVADWTTIFLPPRPGEPIKYSHPLSNANGSPVVISDCTGADNQHWTFKNGAVTAYGGTKCLDATDGVNSNGVKLQIWDCWPNSVNQQWWWTDDNHLAWTNHGRCMDVTDGVLTNGNRIQIWACTGYVEAPTGHLVSDSTSQGQRQSKHVSFSS